MAWIAGNWECRKKITVQHANVDGDLTNHRLLVEFTNDVDIGGNGQLDGDDVRFTQSDGSTELSYERMSHGVAGGNATGVYWVKVPSIAAAGGTFIYIYYGEPAADTTSSATNTWGATDFACVLHMEESGDGSANEFVDSSGSGNHGVGGGSNTQVPGAAGTAANTPDQTTGVAGHGQDFELTTSKDRITLGKDALSPQLAGVGAVSVGAWIKPESLGSGANYNYILEQWIAATGGGISFQLRDSGKLRMGGRSKSADGFQSLLSTDVWISTGVWQYVVGILDFANDLILLYHAGSGGVTTQSNGVTFGDTTYADDGTPNYVDRVGCRGFNDSGGFDGILDEFQLYRGVMSANTIKFHYHNVIEADNELTWGAKESEGGALYDGTKIGIGAGIT